MRPTRLDYNFGKGAFGFSLEPCQICGLHEGEDDVSVIKAVTKDDGLLHICSICIETARQMLKLQ